MHPFTTPLKTLENRKVFWYFQGVEKWCIGNKWVKSKLHRMKLEMWMDYCMCIIDNDFLGVVLKFYFK